MKTKALSLDAYIVDTLMRDLVGHDRRPAAFITYLTLAAHASAKGGALSYRDLADMTGLSRRAVQDAVAHLQRRRLLRVERKAPTEAARYETLSPWRR